MIEEKESLYNIMLTALIRKYGLMLSSSQVAEALSISTRTVDERRKSGRDCPEYIETNGGRGIFFPVQKVVEYQIQKSERCVRIIIN